MTASPYELSHVKDEFSLVRLTACQYENGQSEKESVQEKCYFCQLDVCVREGRCPLLLLRTFSAHAKVVARNAKEMHNKQDTRTGFISCKSGRF